MRVVYCGDFTQGWHTESHVAREFETLGHRVDRFQWDWRAQPEMRVALLDECQDADLLLIQGNGRIDLPDPASLFRTIESHGCITASYHLDLFVGLERQSRIGNEALWHTAVVFTADGDPTTALILADLNIDHRWLPPAVVSDETNVGTARADFAHDVVFVGSAQYHVEHPWRTRLIRNLAGRYGDRFHRYGGGDRVVRGADLNDLYASAKIVVGDSLTLPGHKNYWSDRYFETVGRGGFLIAPRVPGLERFLTDGEHYVGYDIGDFDQVTFLVDHYLDNPTERARIQRHGHAHVAKNHTYRQRVQEMLVDLDLAVAA